MLAMQNSICPKLYNARDLAIPFALIVELVAGPSEGLKLKAASLASAVGDAAGNDHKI